jgi:hypothetical protein
MHDKARTKDLAGQARLNPTRPETPAWQVRLYQEPGGQTDSQFRCYAHRNVLLQAPLPAPCVNGGPDGVHELRWLEMGSCPSQLCYAAKGR